MAHEAHVLKQIMEAGLAYDIATRSYGKVIGTGFAYMISQLAATENNWRQGWHALDVTTRSYGSRVGMIQLAHKKEGLV